MDMKSIKKSYYSINKKMKLFNSFFESDPRCDNIRSECSNLSSRFSRHIVEWMMPVVTL